MGLVCNSVGSCTRAFVTNATQAADQFLKDPEDEIRTTLINHINELWSSGECVVLKCGDCGSRFANPHIAGDAKFYNLFESKPIYPKARWEFELTRQAAFELLKNDDLILEIGGGSGNFVKQLLGLGLDAESVVVTEFSSHAISELINLGVRVEAVDFRDGVSSGPFKVIAMFQTLEHLDRLDDVISSLNEITKQDSHAFVSVPNVKYLEWAELNLGDLDMPPNHITGFSLDGLVKLFTRNGWILQEYQMHERDSLIERCKFGAMRGLQYPKNGFQNLLKRYVNMKSGNHSKNKLWFCAGLVLLTDWRLLQRVPAENIWVHVKRHAA